MKQKVRYDEPVYAENKKQISELRNWYDQIHTKPNTKGKKDKNNYAATKWTDGKQSWQLFPQNVAIL